MARRKKNSTPKRRKRHRLTAEDKSNIVQAYFALGSKYAVTKKLGFAYRTITNVLLEAEQDPNLMAARSRAYDAVGGKITNTVTEIIDSIKPDHLEYNRYEIRDAEGNLKRIIETGPSLRDKAFAAGILTDKIKILQDARHSAHAVERGIEGASLMLPGDVANARSRVAQLVKSIKFIQVDFDDGGKTANRVESLRKKALITDQEVAEAELVDLAGPDPFD